MTFATSLFLIAAGAILKYAVTLHVAGIELQNAGVILMLAGVAGVLLGLSLLAARVRDVRIPPDAR